MRKESVITISNIHGTRVIRAHRVVVFLVCFTALAMAMGVIGGVFWFDDIQEKRQFIQQQYVAMSAKYKYMQTKYDAQRENSQILSEQLSKQETERARVIMDRLNVLADVIAEKKANNIFALPRLVNFEAEPLDKYLTAFNILDNEIYRRALVLQALPSGTPLEEDTYISSGYGVRRHPVANFRQFHHGIDLPLRKGDKVVATASGTVSFVGAKGGYGKVIILDHAYGFSTAYGHLEGYLVSKGDVVERGERVGLGGNTGISTGPHVHYEVRYLDKPVNPYSFYTWNLVNYDRIFSAIKSVKWEPIIAAILKEQTKGIVKEEQQLSLRGPL